MTDPNSQKISDAEIDAHFDELGALSFEQEDGRTLGITLFACKACGALIAVRRAHWAAHQTLGIDKH